MEAIINPDQVPGTIAEAVMQLYCGLDPELAELLSKPEQHTTVLINGVPTEVPTGNTASVHHGIGTGLRNPWSLWKDGPLRRDANEALGSAHGDDISGLIFEWVAARCRGEDYDP